jgi:hypothetical protein
LTNIKQESGFREKPQVIKVPSIRHHSKRCCIIDLGIVSNWDQYNITKGDYWKSANTTRSNLHGPLKADPANTGHNDTDDNTTTTTCA